MSQCNKKKSRLTIAVSLLFFNFTIIHHTFLMIFR